MRSRLPLLHLCLGAVALMTGLRAPAALRAQQRAVPPTPQVSAGPNTLSGIVTDVTGKPLPDVDVYVDQLQRRTRTTENGRFQFESVKEGRYNVGARSIGYAARTARVTVRDSGAFVSFVLERTSFSLPSVITTADRGGLSGVVADTGLKALAGVSVRVIGQPYDERTASAGAFLMPLKPGAYMVRIERDGYARQLIGVTVPPNEGRKIAAWMVPQRGGNNPREGANLFEMRERLLRVGPASGLFYSREDIEKSGIKDLRTFASSAEAKMINQDCPVVINGGPEWQPLWRVMTEEIEYLEIYPPVPARQTAGPVSSSRDRMATQRAAMSTTAGSKECGDKIMVWVRR